MSAKCSALNAPPPHTQGKAALDLQFDLQVAGQVRPKAPVIDLALIGIMHVIGGLSHGRVVNVIIFSYRFLFFLPPHPGNLDLAMRTKPFTQLPGVLLDMADIV